MGASCIWKPGINKDMSGEPSALHSDLVEYTESRPVANAIWAATKVEGVIDTKKLEYDENGEPTLESLNRVINIKKLVGKVSLKAEKRDAKSEDRNGKPILYNTLEEALVQASTFNSENDDVIAYPEKSGKKYSIKVEYKNAENQEKMQQAKFNSQLNNTLLGMMRNLGFTVVYSDDGVTNVFDPNRALETAEGLKAIIRIAKGELGEEAFPEEFAHFMIDGLVTHPLVARILDYLKNDEILRQTLGDEYDAYDKLYNSDNLRLRKEAAGKLLAKYITTGKTNIDVNNQTPKGLLQRLWNYIKNLFRRGNVNDIDSAIKGINQDTLQLASQIKDESILPYFDRTKVISGEKLFKLDAEVSKEQKLAEKALEIAAKRLKILQSRSKEGKYKLADKKRMKNLQNLVDKGKYRRAFTSFLKDTITQLDALRRNLETLGSEVDANDMQKLKILTSKLRQIKEFSDGYTDIVNTMRRMPELARKGEFDLDEEDAEKIAELANKVSSLINDLNGNYIELRNRSVYEFLKLFWGDDKTWNFGPNKGQKLTLTMIMQQATKDINFIDRYISSMASASDPLLALIDKAVKVTRAKRDIELEEIIADIRGAHKELIDAGYNTDFMYNRDENGIPTGWLISNVNYEKYYADRKAFINSLYEGENKDLKNYERRTKIEAWENEHTELVKTPAGREEVRPLASKEGDPYYIDRLKKLNKAQRKYYDEVMEVKDILETNLPQAYGKLHRAVQVRNDLIEGLSQVTSPKSAVKMILGNFTDGMVRRVDDVEYGEDVYDDEEEIENNVKKKQVTLDFSGKPIQKLPVFYTRRLNDMKRLSTDFTGTLMAYSGACVDYGKMNEIVDVLELTRDFVRDRDVNQTSGNKLIEDVFKVMKQEFRNVYTKKGGNIADRLDDYMDSVVYGKHKVDEGSIRIPTPKKNKETGNFEDVEIGVSKLLDSLKSYTGAVGLGFNVFSAISNVTVGKLQSFIDAVSGEYFNMKNLARGTRLYWGMLPNYLGELNSTTKSSKLGLLIDKYDALEEFFGDLRQQKGKYKGAMSRMIKHINLYILNNIGEHNLHCTTMLAMLDNFKVKVNDKETPMVDAWKVRDIKNKEGKVITHELVLVDGTTDSEGNQLLTESLKIERENLLSRGKNKTEAETERLAYLDSVKKRTDDLNISLRLKIGRVNQSLNGAFNEQDRGAINRRGVGRLIMQFRQWMPEHYNRRFAKAYYDPQLEQFREGYYRTIGRFMLNLARDFRHFKFDVITQWRNLDAYERRNITRALTESGLFLALTNVCSFLGKAGWKDKDTETWKKHFFYHLLRLKLEVGASFPWPPSFIKNATTLLQSPAAAISKFNNIAGLFEFWKMGEEITSGRYKGWTQYEKNAYNAIPLYSNIVKVMDMRKENYMFNIFN